MILKFMSLVSLLSYNSQPQLECEPSVTQVSGTNAPGAVCRGALIFEDNFDFLNQKKWSHEVNDNGGGNGEFQVYVNDRQNSFAKQGRLHIRPTLTNQALEEGDVGGEWNETIQDFNDIPSPVRSARLVTRDAFSFKYGNVEISAKMPAGDWLWPAIWFMPKDSEYGTWPASGEIDLTETRGNRDLSINGHQIGTQETGATLHFGPKWPHDAWGAAHKTRNNPQGYDRAFHKYQMRWTPNEIKFGIDNQHLLTVPAGKGFWERGQFQKLGLPNPWKRGTLMAPFDKPFYVIINLAIGGAFFPDNAHNSGEKPWRNGSPHPKQDFWNGRNQWLKTWRRNTDDSHLQVDYVRVWAL